MIKLVISDIDGTLLHEGAQSLDPELFDIIRALKEKGILFAAASGRQYYNLRKLFDPVKDEIDYISENGGMYIIHGETHIPKTHTEDFVKQFVTAVRQDPDCDFTFSSQLTTFIEPGGVFFEKKFTKTANYSITMSEDVLSEGILPMKLAICNANGIDSSIDKYVDLFSGQVHIVTSGNMWMDFMPHGVNKGAALTHLIEELGIKPEECMAFGDQWNDLEMLKMVGVSYAMKNAAPGIAEHCTHTTDSVINELKKLLGCIDL